VRRVGEDPPQNHNKNKGKKKSPKRTTHLEVGAHGSGSALEGAQGADDERELGGRWKRKRSITSDSCASTPCSTQSQWERQERNSEGQGSPATLKP